MIQRNSLSLFSETMPQVNGGATINPRSTDAARNRTPVRARYGTVFVTASLKTGVRLDGTMSTGREIRSYDYVNRPYERVRDALRQERTHGVPVGYEGGCFPGAIGRR